MRTLSITTGWLVSTSSYSVDIQRKGAAGQRMAVCVGGSELALGSTVWRARDASWPAFLKAANHVRETSHQLFPPLLLNLSGAGRISRRSRTSRYSRESASSQRPPRSVISGRPQVSANVGCCIAAHRNGKCVLCFLDSNDRYMLRNKVLYPPPRHPRQPFQAVPLLHEAMVSEPEPAYLRRGLSGRYGPGYSHW